MKKFVSVLLVLTMVLAISGSAMAASRFTPKEMVESLKMPGFTPR